MESTASPKAEHSASLQSRILARLRGVLDPELGVNVVDLGLIYDVDVAQHSAKVLMTLTSAACPLGGLLVEDIEAALSGLEGIKTVSVDFVFEPPWRPDLMSDAAKKALGWDE